MNRSLLKILSVGSGWMLGAHASETPIPDKAGEVLMEYCIDCHDAGLSKGGLDLDVESIDWSDPESRERWQRVLRYSHEHLMPPAKKEQPKPHEREVLRKWLDQALIEHSPVGGTPPRRLSRLEYRNTIRELLGLPDFDLPSGFPRDMEHHGFDNLGAGLVLSPPLMEAYTKVAWEVADELYPPLRKPPESVRRVAGPEDMVISFSASKVVGDALRLASRCETAMRSCTWPSRIEITTSGVYRISVSASTFQPKGNEPMKLELRARDLAASDRTRVSRFRLLKEFSFSKESPETVSFEAELYEGQTVLLRWTNAEMDHDAEPLAKQMRGWFEKDPRVLAAWQKAVFPKGDAGKPVLTALRGANGWKTVKGHLEDPNLDLGTATMEHPLTRKLLGYFNSNQGTFNLADALCHHYFENGPSLEIHSLAVEGPLRVVDGPKDKRRSDLQQRLAGSVRGERGDEAYLRATLESFLPRAFRRPVDERTVEQFLAIAVEHQKQGHRFEEAMHLLLRNILISPRFVYRGVEPGPMDDHDLAARLSYFLTQGPPDATLVDLANRGRLSESWVLEREATRLMPTKPDDAFVESFTGQWLDTDLLPEIMPDPEFRFGAYHIEMARDEVQHFFAEMIRGNRPMRDFIDPDFTYTSPYFARDVYGVAVKGFSKGKTASAQGRKLRRIPVERGGRAGGLLGQSAVMMATANGVDTQPVLRGVWVLENLLGASPPPPPKDVPALTPDTQGTTSPRELLAAHTKDANCASCHRSIDPLGFVLENYDPVGRWRNQWPKGGKIDASGTLPDGTSIKDVVDLKRWLAGNIDVFSDCVATKLMTYATGRVPNYREHQIIQQVVRDNHADGNGFRSLILALIESEVFRAK
ncbi:MAG: DUF1588 domain-containing protein [Haloferula sp.]